MLELRGVEKRYHGIPVVHALDLRIEAGRTYVLIGPSGCGKSTLLRLMMGLISPDAGSVRFQGRNVNGPEVLELRRRMGYVIQDGGLFPHLTASENVLLMAKHLRWEADRLQRRLAELRELVHLPEDSLIRYPAQLSGGQRQRLSLMRALMLEPEILFLDEPLGALDPLIRAELQNDLKDIFGQLRKTVVLVTHDLHEAAFFSDEILLLKQGRVIQRGTIDQLMNAPADAFVEQFISAQRSVLELATGNRRENSS